MALGLGVLGVLAPRRCEAQARPAPTGDGPPTLAPVAPEDPAAEGAGLPAPTPLVPADEPGGAPAAAGATVQGADSQALPNLSGGPTAAPGEDGPAPVAGDAGAPRDDEVVPVQNAAPGAAPPAASTGGPFVIAPESLPVGPGTVGLTVQVFAPEAMNINKDATITIVVKNTTATDARSVVVRDQLPDGVQFVSSQPETAPPAGGIVTWNLDVLPAKSERQLKVVIKPTKKEAQNHTATVQVVTGSRARTVVLQPELRVEQMIDKTSVLKGNQIRVDVTVSNTGDGPARNVLIQAELSEGLSHPTEGRILELPIKEIAPHQTVRLDALVINAMGSGEQTVTVQAESPDVVANPAEAKNEKKVTIVAPMLQLSMTGSELRYTDTDADYSLTIVNPGTAPARDVTVSATLIGDGRIYRNTNDGSEWDPKSRRITWKVGQVEAGAQPRTFVFRVRLGGLGLFKVDGVATGQGGLKDFKNVSTSVEGNADVVLDVKEELRFMDVGQDNVFNITIKNLGSKEAKGIQVRAELSDTLEAVETGGTDQNAGVDRDTRTKVAFPAIARLAPGAELRLGIRAKAKAPGLANCRVFLSHDDLRDFGDAKLEKVAYTKITGDAVAGGRQNPPK